MILTVTLNPCVDRAMFVDRLALHDTNRVARTEIDAGGKGLNLSRVVAELGGRTVATGFLGGGTGAHIREVLDRQGVVHRFVPIAGETRVNFSVEDGTGPPTTFNERGPAISPDELRDLWSLLPELVYAGRWLAVGGSLPAGLDSGIYAELCRFARMNGLKALVDADKEPMAQALAAKPDMVKPNADEAARLLGHPIANAEAAMNALPDLLGKLNDGGIAIISMGAAGAALMSGEVRLLARAPQVVVRSTIGSGDSLLGGLLWGLEEGFPLEEAFRWGIACGSATATTDGAEIARRPVIEDLLPQVEIVRA